MEITQIKVKNFVGIKEVEINPEKFTVISGKNGKGKTSVLEAIKAAFKGAKSNKIRNGQDKAELFIEAGNITIQRNITEKGQYLKVRQDGLTVDKPQTYLDGIIGDFSFEPVKFFLMEAKDQTKCLLNAFFIPVDPKLVHAWTSGMEIVEKEDNAIHALEYITKLHKKYHDKRYLANAEIRDLEAKLKNMEIIKPIAPDWAQDGDVKTIVEDALGRLDKARKNNQEFQALQVSLNDSTRRVEQLTKEIEELKENLVLAEGNLETANTVHTNLLAKLETTDEVEEPNVQELLNQASTFKADTEIYQDKKLQYEEINSKVNLQKDNANKLNKIVKCLSKEAPEQALAQINIPIKGLKYSSEEGFMLNEIQITDLSTAERAVLAVRIIKQLNKDYDIKLMCIDGFEALDQDTKKIFVAEAEKDEFKFFITEVSNDEDVKITTGATA